MISVGGAMGAFARYLIEEAWPTPARGFPASTLLVNTTGCALIGALMVLVTQVWAGQRLVRPFLGTGVLGGYTTFSTYAVEAQRLFADDAARTGLIYLAITPVAAMVAVWAGAVVTRQAIRRQTRETRRQGATTDRARR